MAEGHVGLTALIGLRLGLARFCFHLKIIKLQAVGRMKSGKISGIIGTLDRNILFIERSSGTGTHCGPYVIQ